MLVVKLNINGAKARQLMIEDPIPSGAEEVVLVGNLNLHYATGRDWSDWYSSREFRDNRTVFFLDYFDGDATFQYAMRVQVFFFQAEDGIRDLTVTGVQTCALPIFVGPARQRPSEMAGEDRVADLMRQHGVEDPFQRPLNLHVPSGDLRPAVRGGMERERSEERRVGKECRYRGSTYL